MFGAQFSLYRRGTNIWGDKGYEDGYQKIDAKAEMSRPPLKHSFCGYENTYGIIVENITISIYASVLTQA